MLLIFNFAFLRLVGNHEINHDNFNLLTVKTIFFNRQYFNNLFWPQNSGNIKAIYLFLETACCVYNMMLVVFTHEIVYIIKLNIIKSTLFIE